MNAASRMNQDQPLWRLLATLVVAIGAGDLCFWGVSEWGLSEAVFFVVLAGMILINRRNWTKRPAFRLMLALIAGAAGANVIEPSFSNCLVWLILIVGLAGDTCFTDVPEPWGRFLSQVVAMLRAPGRLFWLGRAIVGALFDRKTGILGDLAKGCLLGFPAIVLLVLFGSLLAQGNAIFAFWTRGFFAAAWTALVNCLDPLRILLWLLIFVLILPLLRPAAVASWWWKWTQTLPRINNGGQAKSAIFSSGLTLLVLNLLFLAANGADAIFLWHGSALPGGVTFSQFVHQGTEFLIATALLSALVLTAIFQQAPDVVRSRFLRWCGLFWVAQNLFLILSVGLRLKHYVESYDMTVLRLGLGIFLALVAVGYGLLTVKIMRELSLSWLIGGCLLAVFGTFYITQFLNLAGWTANYNVARWEEAQETRHLDVTYLHELGPGAWPALARAEQVDRSVAILNKVQGEETPFWLAPPESDFDRHHWREFRLRAWLNRRALKEIDSH